MTHTAVDTPTVVHVPLVYLPSVPLNIDFLFSYSIRIILNVSFLFRTLVCECLSTRQAKSEIQ